MQDGADEGLSRGREEELLRRIRISFIQRATLERRGTVEDIFILDLGLAGVFVERREPLGLDETVAIRFLLPGNDRPVEATCRVVWRQPAGAAESHSLPAGTGLEFVSLAEGDRARIRELLTEHCRRHPRGRQFVRPWPRGRGRE